VPVTTAAPAPVETVAPVVAPVVVATVVAAKPSLLSKVGSFFSGIWSKVLSAVSAVKTWFGDLKTTSSILIGVGAIVAAVFLELTGALRVLVIVPDIVAFIGSVAKVLISVIVAVVSGLVSITQVVAPLILVGAGVYLVVKAIKK
jgi:hypothetical protein